MHKRAQLGGGELACGWGKPAEACSFQWESKAGTRRDMAEGKGIWQIRCGMLSRMRSMNPSVDMGCSGNNGVEAKDLLGPGTGKPTMV